MGCKTGAMILAAGLSSRMGAFKPLLPIGEESALARLVHTLGKAGVQDIAVVTGYRAESLRDTLTALGVREVYNPGYEGGMFTSVLAGLRHFASSREYTAPGVLLTPVDCPLIPAEAITDVLKRATEKPESFIVPACRGKRGHPLFIPRARFAEILAHDGRQGLKGVTRRYEIEMVETGREEVFLDMDTPESYAALVRREKQLRTGAVQPVKLRELLSGRRLLLIRHGQQRQRERAIFLGRTDEPLSERGREQARHAAERLRAAAPHAGKVYTSPLLRAKETAETIAAALPCDVAIAPGLAEMALGGLDGRYIEDFRRDFPEEYARRGRDLAVYKFDADSENFYDLRYRAVTEIAKIALRDTSGELVAVTHAGVIKVLIAELLGQPLELAVCGSAPPHGAIVELTEKGARRLPESE